MNKVEQYHERLRELNREFLTLIGLNRLDEAQIIFNQIKEMELEWDELQQQE